MIQAKPPATPSTTRGTVTSRLQLGDVSVMEARHGSKASLPLHAHPLACVVLVVAWSFEERADGRSLECSRGDVLLRPADAAHADRFGDRGAVYAVVEVPDRVLPALDRPADLLSRIRRFRGDRASLLMREVRRAARRADRPDGPEIEELLLELLRTGESSRMSASSRIPNEAPR